LSATVGVITLFYNFLRCHTHTHTHTQFFLKKSCLGFFFLFFLLTGCNQDEIIQNVDLHNKITYVDYSDFSLAEHDGKSFLRFADQSAFEFFTEKLTDIDQKSKGFILSIEGFNSFLAEFEKYEDNPNVLIDRKLGVYNENYDEVLPIIDLGNASLFCNSEGVFMIGDTVYKMTYHFVYGFHKDRIEDVWSCDLSKKHISHEIKREFNLLKADCKQEILDGSPYSYNNDDYRTKFSALTTNSGLYKEARIELVHQKKGFLGIWSNAATSRLFFNGEVATFGAQGSSNCNETCCCFETTSYQPNGRSINGQSKLVDVLMSTGLSCNVWYGECNLFGRSFKPTSVQRTTDLLQNF
jgi:hypothetical protein